MIAILSVKTSLCRLFIISDTMRFATSSDNFIFPFSVALSVTISTCTLSKSLDKIKFAILSICAFGSGEKISKSPKLASRASFP